MTRVQNGERWWECREREPSDENETYLSKESKDQGRNCISYLKRWSQIL